MTYPNSRLSGDTYIGATSAPAVLQPGSLASAMIELHAQIEEGLELSCKLEDSLGRVLLPSVPQDAGANGTATPRSISPLTDEVETAAAKIGALNSRLRYVLSRLDV